MVATTRVRRGCVLYQSGEELTWLLLSFVPLPKSSQAARIRSNAQVFDFELTDADMAALDSLDKGKAGAVSWNPVDVA